MAPKAPKDPRYQPPKASLVKDDYEGLQKEREQKSKTKPNLDIKSRVTKAIKKEKEIKEADLEKKLRLLEERQNKQREKKKKENIESRKELERKARYDKQTAKQTEETRKTKLEADYANQKEREEQMRKRHVESGKESTPTAPGADIRTDARFTALLTKHGEQNAATNRALADFQRDNPEDYRTFADTVYDNPEDDPFWIALNERAEEETERQLQGVTATNEDRARIAATNLREETQAFVQEHGEKAKHYANQDPLIQAHLSEKNQNFERMQKRRTETSQIKDTIYSAGDDRTTAGIKASGAEIQTKKIQSKRDQKLSPSKQIIANFNHDKKTYETVNEQKVVRDYRDTVSNAGLFELSEDDKNRLRQENTKIDLTDTNFAVAAQFASHGVSFESLTNSINAAGDALTANEQAYFRDVATTMSYIYEVNPEYYTVIQSVAQPTIIFTSSQSQTSFMTPTMPTTGGGIETSMAFRSAGNSVQALGRAGSSRAQITARKFFSNKLKRNTKKVAGKVAKTAAKSTAKSTAKLAGKAAVGAMTAGIGSVALALLDGAAKVVKKYSKQTGEFLGGMGLAAAEFGGAITGFLSAVVTAIVLAITGPILFALLVIPLIVTLILFTLNSNAWVVPLGEPPPFSADHSGVIDSAFIDISKEVSPSAIQNSDLPQTASYTITITAEKGALSNILFDESCNVVTENESGACPPPTNIVVNGEPSSVFPPEPPTLISSAASYIITYDRAFSGTKFNDSRTIDTFSVTADAEGVLGERSADAAYFLIGNPPGPGTCANFGGDITNDMAGRIPGGVVNLLPLSSRLEETCIFPTILVIHWSAGTNDNPLGNEATWSTLSRSPYSCQFGTDTNNAEIWQALYETGVEISQCVGGWNDYTVSIEMAGVWFTDDPPPPNLEQLDITLNTACAIMRQYGIPISQVRGHYELTSGKPDPGPEFLQNVFIPQLAARCS